MGEQIIACRDLVCFVPHRNQSRPQLVPIPTDEMRLGGATLPAGAERLRIHRDPDPCQFPCRFHTQQGTHLLRTLGKRCFPHVDCEVGEEAMQGRLTRCIGMGEAKAATPTGRRGSLPNRRSLIAPAPRQHRHALMSQMSQMSPLDPRDDMVSSCPVDGGSD